MKTSIDVTQEAKNRATSAPSYANPMYIPEVIKVSIPQHTCQSANCNS